MFRRPPRPTRTDPPVPSPTLFRSQEDVRLHHDTGTKRAGRSGRAGGMSRTPDGRLSDLHSRGQVAPEGATGESIRPRLDRKTSGRKPGLRLRSEEHTSEIQSLMRISYAVFCLKKKKTTKT